MAINFGHLVHNWGIVRLCNSLKHKFLTSGNGVITALLSLNTVTVHTVLRHVLCALASHTYVISPALLRAVLFRTHSLLTLHIDTVQLVVCLVILLLFERSRTLFAAAAYQRCVGNQNFAFRICAALLHAHC